MAKENPVVRQVAWKELFPWLLIVRSYRVALDPRKVLIAAAGLFLTFLGCWFFGQLFGSNESVAKLTPTFSSFPLDGITDKPVIDAGSLWNSVHQRLIGPFKAIFRAEVTVAQLAYLLLCCVWTVAVWSWGGGMICRMAAMEFTLEESISTGEAFRHAKKFFTTYFISPLCPLVGVFLALLPMCIAGLLMKFDFGVLLMAILWPLVIAGVLLESILLIGLLLGWPLIWPTTAVEGSDAFEPLSRSFGYALQRPLKYLAFVLLAVVVGTVAWLLVWIVISLMVSLTAYGASWGTGNDRMGQIVSTISSPGIRNMAEHLGPYPTTTAPFESGMGYYGVQVLTFWIGIMGLLALGYGFSYFWTASTSIYLLLRADVEGAEMDEIYRDEQEEEFGLPSLSATPETPPTDKSPEESAPAEPEAAEEASDEKETTSEEKPAS